MSTPRIIHPGAPLEDQVAAFKSLVEMPPEGSRKITITPDLAEHILHTYALGNRQVRSGKVRNYAEDMRRDRWLVNGESLKFSRDEILDGQHRLRACVLAGAPFTTHIIFGIERKTFISMDVGIKRTNSDTLKTEGAGLLATISVPNPAITAQAVRWIGILATPTWDRSVEVSNREVLEKYAKLDPDLLKEAVGVSRRIYGIQRKINKRRAQPLGQTAAMFYYFLKYNRDVVDQILADVNKNEGWAKVAFDKLQRLADLNNGRLHEHFRVAYIIAMWHFYLKGKKAPRYSAGMQDKQMPEWDKKPMIIASE